MTMCELAGGGRCRCDRMGYSMGIGGEALHHPSEPVMAITLTTIAREIEATIFKVCGARIEWYFRSDDKFTICGQPCAVAAAVKYCQSASLAILSEPILYDEETEESYAYVNRV